jgi:hypothetical protein
VKVRTLSFVEDFEVPIFLNVKGRVSTSQKNYHVSITVTKHVFQFGYTIKVYNEKYCRRNAADATAENMSFLLLFFFTGNPFIYSLLYSTILVAYSENII